MKKKILLCLLLLCCAGCGGAAPEAPEQLPELPLGLPEEPAVNGPVGVEHGSSALVEVTINGSEFQQKNPSSLISGDVLILTQGSDEFAWCYYGLAVLEQTVVTGIGVTPIQDNVPYYIALANYSKGHWELLPAVQMGEASVPIADWTAYASPTSSFYFAVIVPEGVLTITHCTVTLDDDRPLPAPTGLTGLPEPGAAQLSWDTYPDDRADELSVYQATNEQLSDAVEISTLDPAATQLQVTGLTNGETYYFALNAFWQAGPALSPYSNVVAVTPTAPTGLTLSGIWPRRGNREDNRGCSDVLGPPSFDMFVSADLASGRNPPPNRTSPAIDDTGSVYALSSDGVLNKYSSDLSTLWWDFSAGEDGPDNAEYVCPPHSPVLDSAGNAYFVAIPVDGRDAQPYVFQVLPDGSAGWHFDAVSLPINMDLPYPTPNMTADGTLIALIDDLHVLVGIDSTGTEVFRYDYMEQIEVHGDLALSSAGKIEVPVWFFGIGVGDLEHWVSLNAADGTFNVAYETLGGQSNVHGGLPLGPYHIYPEQEALVLLDAASGTFLSSIATAAPLTAAPARDLDGQYIFEAHPPYGITGLGDMRCYTLNESIDPPQLEHRYIVQLGTGLLTSQPAVDKNNTVFIADSSGLVYRIEYDDSLPVEEGNPFIADEQELVDGDTYRFSSFALGTEVAYIISEQNLLHCIWNPLDTE